MDQRNREGAGYFPRVMVCGSREGFTDVEVMQALDELFHEHSYHPPHMIVIHGAACGVDTIARRWASIHGAVLEEYPAEWEKHGKAAGYIRNKTMVDSADIVVAFWNGKSKGTYNSINLALEARKELHIYYPEDS